MTTAPGRSRLRSAVAALVLGAGASLAVVGTAGPAAAAECEIGKTQYFPEASPVLEQLALGQAWPIATGRGVTVAVVDSGVNDDNAHFPDGVVLPGTSFVEGDPDPTGRTDALGHGTAVAGIIAARGLSDVKSGMIGAAPSVQILPVRVFTRDTDLQPGDTPLTGAGIAQGIRWAVENGADVVNVSLSTGSTNTSLGDIKSALALAERRDVVVVASTGDVPDGRPTTQQRFPAAGRNVIGVAATNAQGAVDDYSVHGEQVDVAAPGSNVLVTFHADGDCQTGEVPLTSWAAPFVAALAAQLKERYPDESAAELTYRITSTAQRPVAGQRDDLQGWGTIRPYEALTATLDARRAGPAAPGQKQAEVVAGAPTGARPMTVREDPLAPARREVLWWLIGGGGLAALALVLRPLVTRARRD